MQTLPQRYKDPPYPCKRGQQVYRNTGELSFETRPQQAGTFRVTFLEWCWCPDGQIRSPWYARIINQHGRSEVVHSDLISCFNI